MRMTVAAMGKNRDQRRGSFLDRAGSPAPVRDTMMRSRIRARKDARADGRNAKLLKMPILFPKPLETKFSCFAKFSRMPTSFSKLLEMLLVKHKKLCQYLQKISSTIVDRLLVAPP